MDVSNLTIKIQTSGLETAQQGLDKLGQKAHKAETSAGQLANSFKSLNTVIAGVASSLAVGEFIKTADEMSLLNSRLKMTASSMGEFAKQQKEMHKIARDTHSSIKDVTELYVKLSPALKNLGKSTEEVNQVTSNFTKALQLGGASAEESAAAIKQFAQAMGSGMLRGDEFNSMMEASPKLMAYMAQGMNVPIGKLRELGSQGKLTAEAVSNALLKTGKEIEEDFKNMPLTVGKATTDLRTELALLIDDFNKTTGATQSIANSIVFFADAMGENRQEIVTFAKHLGILTAATLATVAAKKALPPVISAAATAYLHMTTNINGATFATRAFNSALAVTKTALKTFLPTALVFGGFELLINYFGDSADGADKLAESIRKTTEEFKKLTEAKRELLKLDLEKELKTLGKQVKDKQFYLETIEKELNKLIKISPNMGGLDGRKEMVARTKVELEDLKSRYIETSGALYRLNEANYELATANKSVITTVDKAKRSFQEWQKNAEQLTKGITTLSSLKRELSEVQKAIQEQSSPLQNVADEEKRLEALEALKIKELKLEEQIANFKERNNKLSTDYHSAVREMSRALMTDHEREIDLIKERTKSWIEAGANAKKALEIQDELIKKANQKEAERELKEANEILKEHSDRLKRENEFLQEYYEMKGDYEKAWQIERLKIEEKYQAILEKEGKKAADDFLKFYKSN